ncbi:YcxB family protein [Actinokineospora sp. PR83]|uniref:YcxB family protein n=1 Tax=Actinokineospora sp. PR83 TaxID=2884908 RepID=UPI001F1C2970|nr:YcxB family protein [Actinokineospora sp. PR83]MCG8918385.1 YcxB family protein [Actinokineospora sp. PR83]
MVVRLRLRWEPVPADWSDGVRAVVPFVRWVPWFAAALGVFSVVLLVLGQVPPGVFGVVCAAVIAVLPGVAAAVAFRRDPIAGRVITADVDDRSLRMMTLDGSAYSEVDLAELADWAETERSFVLSTGGGAFHAVPGRAFGSTEDIDAFRALLAATLGPRERS